MTKPTPSPEQALHVLEILEHWTERGWGFWPEIGDLASHGQVTVFYTDPGDPDPNAELESSGIGLFDALCQATTVMQVLLEEHPGKT